MLVHIVMFIKGLRSKLLIIFLVKATKQESSTASYKVPEYYSHTIDTYADMEIEMASYRQSQPDPRVPYYHHYPWEKSSQK